MFMTFLKTSKIYIYIYICILARRSLGESPLPERPALPSVKRFAECYMSGTRQTPSLPSVTLGIKKHSAKYILPSAWHSTNRYTRQMTRQQRTGTNAVSFAECWMSDTRQRVYLLSVRWPTLGKGNIWRVPSLDTRQIKHIFFFIVSNFFSIVILHSPQLHM
jgi:hypothetical protein